MEASSEAILGWTRVFVLLLGMGWAALLDHKERRVPNDHWLVWAKPAIFLWALDLMVQGADWTIYLTASGVIAYASIAIFGRANLSDARAGSWMDRIFLLWYLVSGVGTVFGAMKYQHTDPLDVVLGQEGSLGILWWKTVSVFFIIIFIDVAWRLRLLHGGADAKALMWVTLVFPSWNTLPILFGQYSDSVVVTLPVSIALLMWGGFAFLLIPFIFTMLNIKRGHLASLHDMRLVWHATKMPIAEAAHRHVWLLTDVREMPDGSMQIFHHTRAPRQTPTKEKLEQHVSMLQGHGVEDVWVSHKMPLLVFLFPAILPLIAFGDPTALLLSVIV